MILPGVLQAGDAGLLNGVPVEVGMADAAAAEFGLMGDGVTPWVWIRSFWLCHGRSRKGSASWTAL